ncbi:hypothetical protein ONE63_002653 [Megalurothrips usitatus]|uniref:Motile sperm domain-containing protein 3 n=1 Tax=Megalurothrips usitatus TaxID=439358 RepID=A0AAV7XCJ3_9NEOP|nr:hypothetical protein ONE63_002653 [Megalurothrips usitatus]
MQPSPGLDQKVPVFVFPQSIAFYLDDQTTHKQVLTLYNPYDFAVRFKVMCTAPNKYTVVDPEGSIKPQCCIDIVVRHNATTPSNCNITDKFRIQMQDHVTKQLIGKRDVTARLVQGTHDTSSERDRDNFQQLPIVSGGQSPQQQQYLVREGRPGRAGTPNYVAVAVGVLCCVALMLPTEGDRISSPLHLSVNFKLVLAYVLGLVTMVVLRPY